jgi:hypothetical protein
MRMEAIRSVLWLLLATCVVPSPLIPFTLNMRAMRASEASFLTGATWHHIPEEDIRHRCRHGNFKST